MRWLHVDKEMVVLVVAQVCNDLLLNRMDELRPGCLGVAASNVSAAQCAKSRFVTKTLDTASKSSNGAYARHSSSAASKKNVMASTAARLTPFACPTIVVTTHPLGANTFPCLSEFWCIPFLPAGQFPILGWQRASLDDLLAHPPPPLHAVVSPRPTRQKRSGCAS